MKSIEKYYDNTQIEIPHKNIKKFIDMKINPQDAIELGCGAGRDTLYLIKNNWNVLAIDRENTQEIITKRLNDEELKRFKFIMQNFESVELGKCNLIVANFSLPFCNKNKFNELWNKIENSISSNRIFCWEFFWN